VRAQRAKTTNIKIIKYRSAARPEPAEGKAENADCVSTVIKSQIADFYVYNSEGR